MDKNDLTLDDFFNHHRANLRNKLNSIDIAKISVSIKKSTRTIENYLNPNYKSRKPLDLLTVRAIVNVGNDILKLKENQ